MVIKPEAIYELAKDGRVMLEMQEFMDMVADVDRLEWLINSAAKVCIRGRKKSPQWSFVYWPSIWDVEPDNEETEWYSNWRDAIDEAMRGE